MTDLDHCMWMSFYNEAMNVFEVCVDEACDYADLMLKKMQMLCNFE